MNLSILLMTQFSIFQEGILEQADYISAMYNLIMARFESKRAEYSEKNNSVILTIFYLTYITGN